MAQGANENLYKINLQETASDYVLLHPALCMCEDRRVAGMGGEDLVTLAAPGEGPGRPGHRGDSQPRETVTLVPLNLLYLTAFKYRGGQSRFGVVIQINNMRINCFAYSQL